MKIFDKHEFWFITGSQNLYGEETLRQVKEDAEEMVAYLNTSGKLPAALVYKPVVTTPEDIYEVIKEANYHDECAGIITWMHTFSPSKMWIRAYGILHKPLMHLHTQFNREIPIHEIDMDFMNSNQSAHADREQSYITTRMRMKKKVVVGYYQNDDVANEITTWMRAAVGVAEAQRLKACRFGDNMREVAVTEGDKVEAQIKLGWSVNTFGIGHLVEEMNNITDAEVEKRYQELAKKYEIETDNIASVKYQVKILIGMEHFFKKNDITAFTTSFEDLFGMEQLPGMACQVLMENGFGFAGEGDWKIACLLRTIKCMAKGIGRGSSFMEDYTYHLEQGNELSLGAHMLEVCPSIASGKPSVIVKPLGIGEKAAPARIVFDCKTGPGIMTTLVDMGDRMRMIVADVLCTEPIGEMENLPVACTMWKPLPDLKTSAKAWLLAGGAHHSVLSLDLSVKEMRDFAEILDIEFIHIGAHTDIELLKQILLLSDVVWKLR